MAGKLVHMHICFVGGLAWAQEPTCHHQPDTCYYPHGSNNWQDPGTAERSRVGPPKPLPKLPWIWFRPREGLNPHCLGSWHGRQARAYAHLLCWWACVGARTNMPPPTRHMLLSPWAWHHATSSTSKRSETGPCCHAHQGTNVPSAARGGKTTTSSLPPAFHGKLKLHMYIHLLK